MIGKNFIIFLMVGFYLANSWAIPQPKPSKEVTMVKVVIMDTGYSGASKKLCKSGHLNALTGKSDDVTDTIGHGTEVLDAAEREVKKYAKGKDLDYCFVVLKVMDESQSANYSSWTRAYQHLIRLKPDFVNMSFATSVGDEWRDNFPIEERAVLMLAAKDTVFYIAAGNVRSWDDKPLRNFAQRCHVFPACIAAISHKNIYVVGGLINGTKYVHPQSNFGGVVNLYKNFCDDKLEFCGTSHASPVAMGEGIAQHFGVWSKPIEEPEDYESRK